MLKCVNLFAHSLKWQSFLYFKKLVILNNRVINSVYIIFNAWNDKFIKPKYRFYDQVI
jgi:hypothetical protein